MGIHATTRLLGGLRSPRFLYHLDQRLRDHRCSWDDVVEAVLAGPATTIGFDVYETLLIREINDQSAFFRLLADRLVACRAWSGSASDYLDARQQAASRKPGENLLQWYRHPELAERADPGRCIIEELDLEASITHAIPGATAALDQLRASGRRLGFISDMYLPGDFISRLLAREDLRRGSAETLLVSGDVGCWKSDGRLFKHWLDNEGVEPAVAAYIGNHPFADHAVPRSMGLQVKGRRNANPNRYEATVAAGDLSCAAIAAASTRARLHVDPGGRDDSVTLGTTVVGQTLMAFLLGIRARCQADDIRQVAFVARDGDLPFRMAEVMPKEYWSGIELHYVHGNRLTWTLAGAHGLGVDRWMNVGTTDRYSFLMLNRETAPLSKLIRRLGVEMTDIVGLHPLGDLDPDQPVPDVDSIWPDFLADERVQALIAERAACRSALVSSYLRGLGLRREVTLIVDVGWRGQTAAVVSGMFEHVLGVEPINYHFGGYGVKDHIDASCRIERYAFDDSVEPAPFHGIDQCIEMFTGAGQPRATGYEQRGPRVEPLFDGGVPAMASEQRDRIWEAALAMAELMPSADHLDRWHSGPPDPTVILDALRQFWTEPSATEGLIGAELLLELDDDGSVVSPMSAPYRLSELRTRAARRWRHGSLAASAAPVRAAATMLGRLKP